MTNKADFITIGQHLAHQIGEDRWSDDILYDLGLDFYRTLKPDCSPRMLLKKLRFNLLGYTVLECALQIIRGSVSNPILICENGAHCMVTVVDTDNPELLKDRPFFMKDATAYFNKYVVIDGLESMEKGAGLALLNSILDLVGDIPVLIQAGYIYWGEYSLMSEDEDYYNLPEKLADYYGKADFHNVNKYIGNYEDSIVMLHCPADTYAKFLEVANVQDSKIKNIADYRDSKESGNTEERLTWKEIKKRYPCQWLGLVDIVYVGNTGKIESAIVKYTDKDLEELMMLSICNHEKLHAYHTDPDSLPCY